MIILTIIAVWFVGSLALVLALARAASRPLPEPDAEATCGLPGAQSGYPEVDPVGVHNLKPAVA